MTILQQGVAAAHTIALQEPYFWVWNLISLSEHGQLLVLPEGSWHSDLKVRPELGFESYVQTHAVAYGNKLGTREHIFMAAQLIKFW